MLVTVVSEFVSLLGNPVGTENLKRETHVPASHFWDSKQTVLVPDREQRSRKICYESEKWCSKM